MSSIGVQTEYVTGKTKAENILEDFNLQNQVVETFHKGVLTVLDKKIKPDLLKALKENQ